MTTSETIASLVNSFDAIYIERQEAAVSRPQFAKYAIKVKDTGMVLSLSNSLSICAECHPLGAHSQPLAGLPDPLG